MARWLSKFCSAKHPTWRKPLSMSLIRTPKKLIEVALPLDDINVASAREKSIRHGHPSTLHLWWARRPLAAARAVIFAQMVNDPGGERGYYAGKTRAQADAEREKLFAIMRDLVLWENTNNADVLDRARAEIAKSWRETCALNKSHPQAATLFNPEQLPAFHDPFAGGGALPLESQRLGLESFASDLNPVAVTINKAMIEIPPKFAGRAPVGPLVEAERGTKKGTADWAQNWSGAKGLAEDVRRYGAWMREQAQARIGHLYPPVKVTQAMLDANEAGMAADGHKLYLNQGLAGLADGQELTVIAWLWARTVKSPNPAFSHVDVPLASSFILSSKPGKESYVLPVVEGDGYRFEVRTGTPPAEAKDGTKLGRGANFRCVMSSAPIEPAYIKAEGAAGRMGAKLMAIVAEGKRKRVYLAPLAEHEAVARQAQPEWKPEASLPNDPRNFWTLAYGLTTFGDLFTPRQLAALTTFSNLVPQAIARARADAQAAGMADDEDGLDTDGGGAKAYAEALGVYLAFAVDRVVDRHTCIATWDSSPSKLQLRNTFARQAIPMTWDFGEGNVFCSSSGTWTPSIEWVSMALQAVPASAASFASQGDAQTQTISAQKVISTDPPYYDNIGYADLSDFFYVWLRRSLRPIFPNLYATLAVPKAEELIATPYRHGSKEKAEVFFLDGMTAAMHNLAAQAHPAFPVTIYYAFKQSDTKDDGGGTHSTGWETFLEAVLRAGFSLTGTWPMRTELGNRMIGSGTNALASSIVLVCRPRSAEAETISRREFQRQLREHLPEALDTMIGGATGQSPIAPVDLAQAAIGPGMAIYSQYAAVLNQDGTPMRVHDALVLINREITDHLTPDAGNFDADTLFANSWFEQYGWATGPFGEANVLAQGKGTTVDGVAKAGVLESGAGKVRLLRWAEYTAEWNPTTDTRAPVWEATHHLIRALNTQGESAAGALLAAMPDKAEPVRQLAYHLYTLCERKKWADDARAYNELITAWHAVLAASHEAGPAGKQLGLDV
jgi:putative DNA methylase